MMGAPMMTARAPLLLSSLLLLSACSAEVEIVTDPVSQAIPVTSVASPVYAEIAIDIPAEARGQQLEDIVIEQLTASGQIVNPSRATSMNLGLRLSFEGTAEPGAIFAFTDLTRPAYFARSSVLLAEKAYAPGTSSPFTIDQAALKQVLTKPRIWLIVSNTVTNLGFGEVLPQEVQLKDVRVRALVTKTFKSIGGVQEVSGL